mmetsp:Transcript_134492/g.335511  ORF Transcript_134492/g.335511 Transcript_134492/m.335511 type:complete len:780 (-) Transcript_134492:40-2379(-)
MKMNQACILGIILAFSSATAVSVDGKARDQLRGDRAVTQVVKLLQSLIDKSKADGDSERNLYAKYKCYCDTNEQQKKAEIERLTEEIAFLEAKIQELLASTGKLSKEVAQLDKDKADNVVARQKAEQVRNKEKEDFNALETDLTDAIDRVKLAIETLLAIGADQTVSSAADHSKFMAGRTGMGLTSLKSTVKKALLAASAFATAKQQNSVEAFLQAPFTGVYSAQSGEVVGILKDMRDTFVANLENARAVEAAAVDAHQKYMASMLKAWQDMDAAYNKKQALLAGNDEDLSAKRSQLADAEALKTDAEEFLAALLDMCAAKKKQYDERVALRAQEEAALAEALSIINSDAAFAAFGTTKATSSTEAVPAFFQIRRHRPSRFVASVASHQGLLAKAAAETVTRQKAQAFLQGAAEKVGGQGSTLLGSIVAMLQANNPFATVLEEIEKMIKMIDEEGKADKDQKAWCHKERTDTNRAITAAQESITTLTGLIDEDDDRINNPETGLIANIDKEEGNLRECITSQQTETADRTEANVEYQQNIEDLVEAQALLARAVQVLDTYYSKIAMEMKQAELLQVSRNGKEGPSPPATWEDTYVGQKQSGGTDAISMLQFLIKNTKQEQVDAHDTELADQHAYEDSMTRLKGDQMDLEAALAQLKSTLAETQKNLIAKQKDLKKTEEEKAALEAYRLKIKPGCDFIKANLDGRMSSRATEKQALEDARDHLKGTPVFNEAMEVAHNESLHDCLDVCAPNELHVKCKACLADVTIPAFCAGHRSTFGCD